MGNCEVSPVSEYPLVLYLFSPCCPGLFAEAGEKLVCRGQWFVPREGFQAFPGTVRGRAERGGLCSLRRGDHPKGSPLQAPCQPGCLLLCHGECFPKPSPGARLAVLCSWKRCQEAFQLVLSTPCSNTGGDNNTQKSLQSPHSCTVLWDQRGPGLRYWQCSSGLQWWGISTIQSLPVLSKYFSGMLFITLEALVSSFETLEDSRKSLGLEGTCSIRMEMDSEIPRL